jgi:hypothetical protein
MSWENSDFFAQTPIFLTRYPIFFTCTPIFLNGFPSAGTPKSRKTLCFPCQDMSGHDTRPSRTVFHVRTWNPAHRDSQVWRKWMSMSGHETRSTGSPKLRKTLCLPCQDMKPGPGSNWCTTICTTHPIYAKLSIFFVKLYVLTFKCNAFVLVLVQIDLIHFEHTKCISLLQLKLIQIRYI